MWSQPGTLCTEYGWQAPKQEIKWRSLIEINNPSCETDPNLSEDEDHQQVSQGYQLGPGAGLRSRMQRSGKLDSFQHFLLVSSPNQRTHK